MARAPGTIRDVILEYMSNIEKDAQLRDIQKAVNEKLGEVSPSSVRSYMNINVPRLFERTGRGRYKLWKK